VRGGRRLLREQRRHAKSQIRADEQAAAGDRADPDERATIDEARRNRCVGGMFHDRPPCAGVAPAASSAARLMPSRIRTYDAQRQRLPVIARAMSASVGCGLSLSNADAVMSCPA